MLKHTEKYTPSDLRPNSNEQAFVARALQSREQAKQQNEYYSAEFVLNELRSLLAKAGS